VTLLFSEAAEQAVAKAYQRFVVDRPAEAEAWDGLARLFRLLEGPDVHTWLLLDGPVPIDAPPNAPPGQTFFAEILEGAPPAPRVAVVFSRSQDHEDITVWHIGWGEPGSRP